MGRMTDQTKAVFQAELVALVPRLRRFALSLAGNKQDADDLVQAACEKALRNWGHFVPGTRMDSWMYRIIQNLWLDDRRKNARQGAAIDPDDAHLSDDGKAASLPQDRMMLAQTRRAMTELPERQREVLALVAIEGLSYREVADTLQVPIGTVMSRLSRAREALLPKLGLSAGRRQ
jgi:RNA polymerase sigma-70 factor (ECF subfamily)